MTIHIKLLCMCQECFCNEIFRARAVAALRLNLMSKVNSHDIWDALVTLETSFYEKILEGEKKLTTICDRFHA